MLIHMRNLRANRMDRRLHVALGDCGNHGLGGVSDEQIARGSEELHRGKIKDSRRGSPDEAKENLNSGSASVS